MLIKLAKDHLPWVVPSVAIVFAASGYFDRDSGSGDIVMVPAPAVTPQSAMPTTTFAQSTPPAPQETADVVTRLSTVTDSSLQLLNTTQATLLESAVARSIAPTIETPAPVVAAPAPVERQTASLGGDTIGSDFFANAQANLAAQESCVGDLRTIAEQARVYFPAGGLTADVRGIEQARLIVSLVQECDGVQIIVEGHSDPSGNPVVNQRLSKQRAEQVIQRLGASGLDMSNFVAEGMGSSKPSTVVGPETAAYYDRRVEFVVIESRNNTTANRTRLQPSAWASSSCVTELENAIIGKEVFYAPRSVAAQQEAVSATLELATMAMACPNARLRVIGQHSDDLRAGEGPATGRLRAKAMMAMLVGQGIDSEQIIIAAPSRSMGTDELSGSRLDFDVILD